MWRGFLDGILSSGLETAPSGRVVMGRLGPLGFEASALVDVKGLCFLWNTLGRRVLACIAEAIAESQRLCAMCAADVHDGYASFYTR